MRCVTTDTLSPSLEDSSQRTAVRLTQQVKAGGCASKLAPGLLSTVLSRLPRQQHPDLLVGFEHADDAGIFRIGASLALVQTVDFFTPMVDDPFTYGRIAATNALSDVYAMGGKPVTALAVLCYPPDGAEATLEQIMRGGLETMRECGCVVVGGHSVRDAEIKFGYAVTGLIDPAAVLTNAGAQPGDVLLFTKALGTGVITTALKQGKAEPLWVEAATRSMTQTNRKAANLLRSFAGKVHAMTDVTGFGMMGHAREMALASNVELHIEPSQIPLLPGACACVVAGCIPAGLRANREFAECMVSDSESLQIPEATRALLFDPQTAGGLLLSIEPGIAETLLQQLREAGYPAARIGQVRAGLPRIVLC